MLEICMNCMIFINLYKWYDIHINCYKFMVNLKEHITVLIHEATKLIGFCLLSLIKSPY